MDNDREIEISETPETEPAPEGWVQIPILRGIYEVEPLLDLCDRIGGYIIGGYARFCCSPSEKLSKAGDVDIFPVGNTEEESKAVFAEWISAITGFGLKQEHENNVSVSFSGKDKPPFNRCPTIQIIKPIQEGAIVTWGELETILDNFDFSVVRAAINRDRKTATAWASFLGDEERKKLRILNIHCPISSLLRVCKYVRKGYFIRPIEALKLFADWQQRTEEYRTRISDLFLTGKMGKMSQQEIDELEGLLRVD